MSAADSIAFIEAENTLAVESLDTLPVVSVDWCSVRLIKPYENF